MTRSGHWWRAAIVGVLLLGAGCSHDAPAGLGIKACPYVRPRLVRVDRDVLQSSTADLGAVAQDFALYVGQLPDGGKAKADRQLVRFTDALRAATQSSSAAPAVPGFAPAEADLKRRCKVAS